MTKRYVSRISIAIETIVSVTMVGLKGVVTRLLTFKCPSCDFSLMWAFALCWRKSFQVCVYWWLVVSKAPPPHTHTHMKSGSDDLKERNCGENSYYLHQRRRLCESQCFVCLFVFFQNSSKCYGQILSKLNFQKVLIMGQRTEDYIFVKFWILSLTFNLPRRDALILKHLTLLCNLILLPI